MDFLTFNFIYFRCILLKKNIPSCLLGVARVKNYFLSVPVWLCKKCERCEVFLGESNIIKGFSQYLQCFRVCRGWAPWPLQDWLHISRPPGHYGHGLDPLWKQPDSSVAHLLCCKYQEVSWCFIKPVFIHLHICASDEPVWSECFILSVYSRSQDVCGYTKVRACLEISGKTTSFFTAGFYLKILTAYMFLLKLFQGKPEHYLLEQVEIQVLCVRFRWFRVW